MARCETRAVHPVDHDWVVYDMYWDKQYQQFRTTIQCSHCRRKGWGYIEVLDDEED